MRCPGDDSAVSALVSRQSVTSSRRHPFLIIPRCLRFRMACKKSKLWDRSTTWRDSSRQSHLECSFSCGPRSSYNFKTIHQLNYSLISVSQSEASSSSSLRVTLSKKCSEPTDLTSRLKRRIHQSKSRELTELPYQSVNYQQCSAEWRPKCCRHPQSK